jgi:hypothetical protein
MPSEMITHIYRFTDFKDRFALAGTCKEWAIAVRWLLHRSVTLKTSTSSTIFFTAVTEPNIQHLIPYHSCVGHLTLEFDAIPRDSEDQLWDLIKQSIGKLENMTHLRFQYSHVDPQALSRLAAVGPWFNDQLTCLSMVPLDEERQIGHVG